MHKDNHCTFRQVLNAQNKISVLLQPKKKILVFYQLMIWVLLQLLLPLLIIDVVVVILELLLLLTLLMDVMVLLSLEELVLLLLLLRLLLFQLELNLISFSLCSLSKVLRMLLFFTSWLSSSSPRQKMVTCCFIYSPSIRFGLSLSRRHEGEMIYVDHHDRRSHS